MSSSNSVDGSLKKSSFNYSFTKKKKKKKPHKTLPAHQGQSNILTGHQHYVFSGRPLISNVESIHLVGNKSTAGEQVITNKTEIKFEIVKNVWINNKINH